MDFQVDLSWRQARTLMRAGAMIRRIGWLDRWLLRIGFWEYMLYNTGEMRVVQAPEFGASEFAGNDWTTMWPDQWNCLHPEIPPVDPQPEAGGPVVQKFGFRTETGQPGGKYYPNSPLYGVKEITNPLNAPAKVWLHGVADDRFRVKSPSGRTYVVVSTDGSADWNYTATVDYRFLLGAGQSFTIAGTNEGGGPCKYDVTGEFSL